jgi:hypothetical protein
MRTQRFWDKADADDITFRRKNCRWADIWQALVEGRKWEDWWRTEGREYGIWGIIFEGNWSLNSLFGKAVCWTYFLITAFLRQWFLTMGASTGRSKGKLSFRLVLSEIQHRIEGKNDFRFQLGSWQMTIRPSHKQNRKSSLHSNHQHPLAHRELTDSLCTALQ